MALLRRLFTKLRGGITLQQELHSPRLRAEYAAHGVKIGMYSYGCFDLRRFPPGVTIGRYCSIAPTATVFLRNHGIDYLGMSALLYRPELGVVDEDSIPFAGLTIGDDVWLAHNSIILPGVATIGRGAVVAAGAVVTRPVPPYAIVAGNPARVVRLRFPDPVIAAIEATRWWELDTSALRQLVLNQPDMIFRPERYFA